MHPMKRVLVFLILGGCYQPPYAGPTWGDPCQTDKGEHVISGCTHPSDGTGDSAFHSEIELGLCAPPSAETLAAMSSAQRVGGYTGACRPFCDLGTDGVWSCPMGGVPTLEAHAIGTGLEFCYCADPDVDDMSMAVQ